MATYKRDIHTMFFVFLHENIMLWVLIRTLRSFFFFFFLSNFFSFIHHKSKMTQTDGLVLQFLQITYKKKKKEKMFLKTDFFDSSTNTILSSLQSQEVGVTEVNHRVNAIKWVFTNTHVGD